MLEPEQRDDYFNAEAASVASEEVSFSFGVNWKRFLSQLDDAKQLQAVKSFCDFTNLTDLRGHTFLDIGCGSGLSSLVALRLGADRVVSVDIDPHSVDCAIALRNKLQITAETWDIRQGSALNPTFLKSLGRFSYVHSWGVLHHTGAMWPAIEHVIQQNTQPGGMLQLALYSKHKTSARWLKIKRLANGSPRLLFPVIKWSFISLLFAKQLSRFQSPIRYVREYSQNRGMNFYRDIDDWVGGLPYEYCSPEEVLDFLAQRQFVLRRLKTTDSCGCNEFLFQRDL